MTLVYNNVLPTKTPQRGLVSHGVLIRCDENIQLAVLHVVFENPLTLVRVSFVHYFQYTWSPSMYECKLTSVAYKRYKLQIVVVVVVVIVVVEVVDVVASSGS